MASLSMLPSIAAAQPGIATDGDAVAAEPAKPKRSGLMGGLGFGGGGVDVRCNGCPETSVSDGLSLIGHAGYMLNPRLALLGEAWHIRWSGRDNVELGGGDHHVEQTTLTAAAQLWLHKRIWIRAGIGASRHTSDVDYSPPRVGTLPAGTVVEPGASESRYVGSAIFALGIELIRREDFAIDLQFRGGASSDEQTGIDVDSNGFIFGLNWY
jgi:hypothetical protein